MRKTIIKENKTNKLYEFSESLLVKVNFNEILTVVVNQLEPDVIVSTFI